jgi:hypothetical protein
MDTKISKPKIAHLVGIFFLDSSEDFLGRLMLFFHGR